MKPKYSINLNAYNYVDYHKDKGLHCCDWGDNFFGAINWCHEDENHNLWCGNGEYISLINFCPNDGFESKNKNDLKEQ